MTKLSQPVPERPEGSPTEPENRATSFRVPRSSAKLGLELLKSWTPNLIERVHYYGDLKRKYSRAKQLIVRLQKECETLNAKRMASLHVGLSLKYR